MDNKKLGDELNKIDKQIMTLTIELETLRDSYKEDNYRKEHVGEITEKIKQLEIEITRLGGKKEEIVYALNKHVVFEA